MKLSADTKLGNGKRLLAWYANNRGRGRDNCTLAVVEGDVPRAAYSRNQTGIIATARTSSWRGDVNLSRAVRDELGLAGGL